MKKLLVFAVIAATFASCSNGTGDKKVEEVKTSDTTAVVAAPDTSMVVKDTTVKTTTTVDTLKK